MAKNRSSQYNERMLNHILSAITYKIWPELETMSDQRRLVGMGDIFTLLYSLPLALIGLVWLIATTSLSQVQQNIYPLTLILLLIIFFSQVGYFILVEIRTDRYARATGSLATMVLWSGLFLFGQAAIWPALIWLGIDFGLKWRKSPSPAARWSLLRNMSIELVVNGLALLISLNFYRSLGGAFPLSELTFAQIVPALLIGLVHFGLVNLAWAGYILYHLRVQIILTKARSFRPILKFVLFSVGLPYLAHPFAILAAGLYVQNGLFTYLFFLAGLLLVAVLGRQLSRAMENSRQQSRLLERLEQLGRAIISASPQPEVLAEVLAQHLQNMFPSGNITVWLAPGKNLFKHPEDSPPVPDHSWDWIMQQNQAHAFCLQEPLPWQSENLNRYAVVVAPILAAESNRAIGGIYLELRALVQDWDKRALENLFPAVHSLGANIASALHQSEVYANNLAYQQLAQELSLAGQIQASFLPNQFPTIPGWQLAVTLLPARETSGDYFDVITLSEGRLGILIADVADKGIGPALYMALSRTLIRTYAVEYEAEPEVVFFAANNRLLQDARANLFVTAFYGVLDPLSGSLTYCNAGHNPPYLISAQNPGVVQALGRTGMAIGIEEEATWKQATVQIAPGDTLLLYTDGIPDAQNDDGAFFEDEAMIETAQSHLGETAHEIQAAILEEVENFVGAAPQFDDITLMVLLRDL